jgi:rare lipoprotein A (peptidoglycan hydrolase)
VKCAIVLAAAAVALAGCGKSTATAAEAPVERPSGQPASTVRTQSPSRATTPADPAATPAHPVPVAFRPAPGVPSDAEIAQELAQIKDVQRRREILSHLSPAPATLSGLLPWSLEEKSGIQVSIASEFTAYGHGVACGGVEGRYRLGVAHKTAPCGTLITFRYGEREITVPVIDRGPYIAGREWDLTGATAEALHFPGLGRIEWWLAR